MSKYSHMTLAEIKQTAAYKKIPFGLDKGSMTKSQLLKLLGKTIIVQRPASHKRLASPRRQVVRYYKSPRRRYTVRYASPRRHVSQYYDYDEPLYWYTQRLRNLANWVTRRKTTSDVGTDPRPASGVTTRVAGSYTPSGISHPPSSGGGALWAAA